jgi:hypothetical protein
MREKKSSNQKTNFLNQLNSFRLFLLFFLITFICNIFALHGEPIWDDHYYFLADKKFLNATFLQLWQGSRWPIFKTFLLAQYKLFGTQFLYYHLVNFILHALNGLLLFKVMRQLKLKYALTGCIFFLIHPATIQSVAWMFQVKTLLATSFALLSILTLINWCLTRRVYYLISSFVLLILSFYTKSIFLNLWIFSWPILSYLKISKKQKYILSGGYTFVSVLYLVFFLTSEQNIIKAEQAQRVQKVKVTKSIDDLPPTPKQDVKTNKMVIEKVQLKLDEILPNEIKSDEKRKQDILNFYQAYLLTRGQLSLKREWDILRERTILWLKIHSYYLYRLINPLYMAPVYSRFKTELTLFNLHVLWLGFFVVFLFLVWNFYLLKQKRFSDGSIILQLAFFTSLAPYSGIYFAPYMSITHVSDHHLYPVLILLIPALLYYLAQLKLKVKLPVEWVKWTRPVLIIYGLCLMAYSTYYSQFFINHEKFYNRVIKYYPTQMVAYFNLAESYRHKNNYEMTAKTLLAGFNAYKAHYPQKVIGAKIPSAILTEKLWHPVFFQHPELDPYFLMIVRYLEYFRDKSN